MAKNTVYLGIYTMDACKEWQMVLLISSIGFLIFFFFFSYSILNPSYLTVLGFRKKYICSLKLNFFTFKMGYRISTFQDS